MELQRYLIFPRQFGIFFEHIENQVGNVYTYLQYICVCVCVFKYIFNQITDVWVIGYETIGKPCGAWLFEGE